MRRPSQVHATLVALSLALAAPQGTALAQARRPTPHQALDRALRPISEQLDQLNATEAERRDLSDLSARAEALAATMVEAQHRGDTARTEAMRRRIELIARVARGRVEAARAEANAAETERAALAAEERRTQARAALERAVERRLELERQAASQPQGSSEAPTGGSAQPPATPATTVRSGATPQGRATPSGSAPAPRGGR